MLLADNFSKILIYGPTYICNRAILNWKGSKLFIIPKNQESDIKVYKTIQKDKIIPEEVPHEQQTKPVCKR